MTTHTAKAGIFSRRMLAVAATAAIALSLALTLRVALANDLNQDPGADGIWWEDAPQGSAGDCEGADLDPGQVLWHFVHTDTGSSDLPSTLNATFDVAGAKQASGFVNGNSNVFYEIITGEDSLLSASDSIQNDGLLNLSHVCFGGEAQSVPPSAEQSVAASVSASVPPSAEGSVKAGTGTPAASTSNTALFGNGSNPLPTIAFSLILLASLGTLAYANVKSVRS